jgi:hypothetical protein
MKKYLPLALALLAPVLAAAADRETLKAELVRAEADFCRQAAELGIGEAFAANMADQAFDASRLTLSRAEYEAGLKAARAKGPAPKGMKLVWAPMMVDVSDDGTLGYTWGKYEFTPPPAADGKAAAPTVGIYFTVWKRQADGSWKFVYDGGPKIEPAERLQKFLARPDLPQPPKS